MAGCDVLIVDDDRDIARLMEMYFTSKRLKTSVLARSEDYAKDIRAADPRLVLLDVRLPGTDGYKLCAELKKQYDTEGMKVILVTAMSREDVEHKMASAHADGFLLKPFSLDDLDTLHL